MVHDAPGGGRSSILTEVGQQAIQPIISTIKDLAAKFGKPKKDFTLHTWCTEVDVDIRDERRRQPLAGLPVENVDGSGPLRAVDRLTGGTDREIILWTIFEGHRSWPGVPNM